MSDDVDIITYKDELMADKTVCRRFSDGRTEWRSRLDARRVSWRDDRFDSGVDELLGDGVIRRSHADGRVEYAREQGFGRTAWRSGRVLTVNESSLGGRAGAALEAAGAGALLGALVPPPDALTAAEEEELRRKAATTNATSYEVEVGEWDEDDEANDLGDADFG
jgi:hypothetical protein